ncbi:MAG: LysR family transcriptional regulator [Pseudomonadota bacterium]
MDILRGFRQLQTLGETGNYRKAAARLGMTHSALSQSIARLEQHYGVSLFVRGKRGTVPTAIGRRLLESASIALAEMERAERDVAQMRDNGSGSLVIGADPNLSESLLAPVLIELMQLNSDVRIRVHSCNWNSCTEALREKRIDLYIGLPPEHFDDSITWDEMPLAPPLPLCRNSHPLASRESVTSREVVQYPVLAGDVPDWLLEKIRGGWPDQFKNIEEFRSVFLTTHDMGLLRQLLLSTDAVAVVSPLLFRQVGREDQITVLPVEGYPLTRAVPGVVARLRDLPLLPVADQLCTRMREIATRAAERHGA